MTESDDSTADDASSPVAVCDTCGSLLDLSTWTPTTIEDDTIYRFCDEDCRDAWRAD